MDKEEFYKRIDKDIVPLEDGYKYYWAEGRGALAASELRSIADYLDKLNFNWDLQVKEYFEKERNCTCKDTTAISACPVHGITRVEITRG